MRRLQSPLRTPLVANFIAAAAALIALVLFGSRALLPLLFAGAAYAVLFRLLFRGPGRSLPDPRQPLLLVLWPTRSPVP